MVDKLFAWAATVVFVVVLLMPKSADAAEPKLLGAGGARENRPCVLMLNQNVLFGTASQRGELVVVRRDDDSEIQLPRKEVACWAKSIRGLYQYRTDNRSASGLEYHLDSARWCLRYGLLDLATKELRAAYRIAPGHPAIDVLERNVAKAEQHKATKPVLRDPTKPTFDQSKVKLVSHNEEIVEPAFDPLTLQRFARHIQPLLMNRCANCHSTDTKRNWRIQTSALGSRLSAKISKANLAATLPFINVDTPLKSELYLRATDSHAGKTATLGTRAPLATRSLEAWLRSARVVDGDSGHKKRSPKQTIAQNPVQQAGFFGQGDEDTNEANRSDVQPASAQETGMSRLPAVSNPFDPELFNKRFHGTKK